MGNFFSQMVHLSSLLSSFTTSWRSGAARGPRIASCAKIGRKFNLFSLTLRAIFDLQKLTAGQVECLRNFQWQFPYIIGTFGQLFGQLDGAQKVDQKNDL